MDQDKGEGKVVFRLVQIQAPCNYSVFVRHMRGLRGNCYRQMGMKPS